jgi:hypothetical protein
MEAKKSLKNDVDNLQGHELVDSSYLYERLKSKQEESKKLNDQINSFTPEMFAMLPKYTQKAYGLITEQIQKMTNDFDSEGSLYKLSTQKGLKELKEQVLSQYSRKTKEELIEIIFSQSGVLSINKQIMESLSQELRILRPYFYSSIETNYKSILNRQKERDKVFKSNNECLKQCYSTFAKDLERPIKKQDYPAFKKFLLKLYPQPFIPEPRLTKKEKQQPKEIQSEDRDLKIRSSWSDATVRAAFEKFSGVKPTTLKK